MNLFNCFQAVAFYTVVPFGIQYLANSGNTAWAVVVGIGQGVGFVMLSIAVHESSK